MNLVKTVALLGILSALLVTVSYWLIGGTTGATIGLLYSCYNEPGFLVFLR
ncbi:hypothetical protein [Okeania sp. SIO2C2]|uniref:hypothetical protein n=1 Tax=Okeania sp. SIO2C2 TaxID=2607787 RepID=UPI00338EC615